MADKTTKVKVGVLGFPYAREITQHGNAVTVQAYARKGDTIEVNDQDLARGEALNAFDTGKSSSGSDAESVEPPQAVVDMSDDELDEWFEESSPTVQQVIDAADGDAENAQRLLDAESRTSGNDPRVGVQEGLSKIVEG